MNTPQEKKQFYLFKRVSIVDKYNFYEYLSVMLDSGIIISEALDSVSTKIENPYFREKIQELVTYVSSGDSFSKAMKKTPQIFESGEISIIESGESIGNLAVSLAELSEDLRKIHELHQKVKSALTYPAIIFSFLLIAILVVLTYVIPAIKPLFDTTGVALPKSTQSLIFVSDFISSHVLLLTLFVMTLVLVFLGYKSTKSGKERIDLFLLSLPLFGPVYKNYIISKVSSNLGSLLGSGVNVIKTLTLVGRVTNNAIYEMIFESISKKVSKGSKIVDAMKEVDKDNKYLPRDFLQMLSVGEKTASIEKVSKKINKQYVREVDYSLANLTKWIEPVAILITGIFVLWFAFAIFGAILKVTQTVGA